MSKESKEPLKKTEDVKDLHEKNQILEDKEEIKEEREQKAIVIKADAYKNIILYASRYANKSIPSEEWKEIYGILIGYTKDDLVFIERAEALAYGHATDVQLDAKHYVFIDEIQQKLDKEGKGYYMVGWYHSHPGLNLFFSYIDIMNQLGFQQNNPDFCGLVFDHTLLGKKKEEKIEDTEGVEHSITKFDTGFEIYRITDVNMSMNAPEFDTNYHNVDYIVEGLNKFFFANVLAELSALVTAGKPLESAYGEAYGIESPYEDLSKEEDSIVDSTKFDNNNENVLNQEILTEIPNTDNIVFDVDDFFYDDAYDKNTKKEVQVKEDAEQLIYEGNQSFKERDSFTGVEKFRQAMKNYKKIDEYDKILDLLNQLSEKCISSDHLNLAEEFVEELYNLANSKKNLFYRGKGNFLKGYLLLKKGDNDVLKEALKNIQNGAIDYVKEQDFAGAGMCFHKIGTIYHLRLDDIESGCLFYREAVENYNNSLVSQHPLRKSLWSKQESLISKIIELKDLLEELLPKLENFKLRDRINNDLKSIDYNF
jgi:proteasome lid subunit RPN8/RPN11